MPLTSEDHPSGPAPVEALRDEGFVVLRNLLDAAEVEELRASLAPLLEPGPHGRNDFEGTRTQRVYSIVGKGRPFERLVEHPRILALLDAFLAPRYLLTASQAIVIHPGETPQPLHSDDTFYPIPRPRAPISLATIFALDDFTATNGATEIVPGSHRWSDEEMDGFVNRIDMRTRPRDERTPDPDTVPEQLQARLVPVEMPAGSVIVFLGTLVHRGGANRTGNVRRAISNQYCEPWARPQENFFLSLDPEVVRAASPRVRSLLGYSIHPPFMGHQNGLHPLRAIGIEPGD